MAQLIMIRAVMEQRWDLKEDLWSSNKEEGCYDLSLELRLHLGKDLRVGKGRWQLVKHKEYRSISTLYI